MVADVEYDNVLRRAETAVVDNKNDLGISELKSNLYKTAEGLLRDILVPLSWLRLLEKVREELPLKDNEICAPLEICTKSSKNHWDHGKGSALCGALFL